MVLAAALGIAVLEPNDPLSPPGAGTAGPSATVHTEGPPPGHTGGFGEPSCRACHNEFDPNVGGSLSLEGLPAAYEAGTTYVVSVVLRSTEMRRAGFQAAVRFAGGAGPREGVAAGRLESVDARTAVAPDSAGTMRYVQHVAAGAEVKDPELATWRFLWTAPPEARGAVVFHAAANSANGDDSPLGDLVYTTELRLESRADLIPGSRR